MGAREEYLKAALGQTAAVDNRKLLKNRAEYLGYEVAIEQIDPYYFVVGSTAATELFYAEIDRNMPQPWKTMKREQVRALERFRGELTPSAKKYLDRLVAFQGIQGDVKSRFENNPDLNDLAAELIELFLTPPRERGMKQDRFIEQMKSPEQVGRSQAILRQLASEYPLFEETDGLLESLDLSHLLPMSRRVAPRSALQVDEDQRKSDEQFRRNFIIIMIIGMSISVLCALWLS